MCHIQLHSCAQFNSWWLCKWCVPLFAFKQTLKLQLTPFQQVGVHGCIFNRNGCCSLGHHVWSKIILLIFIAIEKAIWDLTLSPLLCFPQVFPINIKGIGGSLVTLVNWFGSWAVSYAFNFLMSWSSAGKGSATTLCTALLVLKII